MKAKDYLLNIKSKIDRPFSLKLMPKKGAVIVETRAVKDFGLIVKNHLHFLPKDYGLTVIHSNHNREFVNEELQDVMGVNWLNIGNTHLSEVAYNYLLTSEWFWKMVPYEKTLIFQTDSLLLRHGIEAFEQFDYIGAPWKHIGRQVGNGGLSLRTNEYMKRICKQWTYNHMRDGNEDIFFSNHVEITGGIKATTDEAMSFSVETMYYENPIGVHAADKWLSPAQLQTIYQISLNEL